MFLPVPPSKSNGKGCLTPMVTCGTHFLRFGLYARGCMGFRGRAEVIPVTGPFRMEAIRRRAW